MKIRDIISEGWKTGATLGGIAGGMAAGMPGAAVGAGLGAIAGYFMKGKDPKKIPGFVDHVDEVKKYVLDRLPKTSYGELVMSAKPELMTFTQQKFDQIIEKEIIPEYFIKKYGQERGSYIIDRNPELIKALYAESQGLIRWIIPITIDSKSTRDYKQDLVIHLLGNDPKYLKYFGISQSDEWDQLKEKDIKDAK